MVNSGGLRNWPPTCKIFAALSFLCNKKTFPEKNIDSLIKIRPDCVHQNNLS